jgi:DNA-binding MarR family transcriptional regulator
MSLELFNLLWDKKKEAHIRPLAKKFLIALRDKKSLTGEEAKQIVGRPRTYYKIVAKLKAIGLLKVHKDPKTRKLVLTYSFDSYEFFVKRYLLENVKEFFKTK